MNKGVVYALLSVALVTVVVAVAAVTLPHYHEDTPKETVYEVTGGKLTTSGDCKGNLSDTAIYYGDFDDEHRYPLSGEKGLPSGKETGMFSFAVVSNTEPLLVNTRSSESDGVYTVVIALDFKSSAMVITFDMTGMSSVEVVNRTTFAGIRMTPSMSCSYNVDVVSSEGHIVELNVNGGSVVDGSGFSSVQVCTAVPSSDGVTGPDGLVFARWANNAEVQSATVFLSPGDTLMESMTLYAVWGKEAKCTGNSCGEGSRVSDVGVKFWDGSKVPVKDVSTFRSPAASSLWISAGKDVQDVKIASCVMKDGYVEFTVEFRYADCAVDVTLTMSSFSMAVPHLNSDGSVQVDYTLKDGSSFTVSTVQKTLEGAGDF